MHRAMNLKRVSWASGSNLSQVKPFSSEDSPSMVGHKSNDHLQSKTMSIGPSITDIDDDLPPGFEHNHVRNQSKAQLSHIIPQIKWECPPMIALNYGWHIAAGEDSREKHKQKFREMRVLEAIYPRPSAIPSSPSVSSVVENEYYDDSLTPLIPLTPVEEEVEDIEPESPIKELQSPNSKQKYIPPPTSSINPQCNDINSHCSGKPLGAATSSEADIVEAAAAAAIAAIVKTNEQGSVVDMDMLLKLFTDPTMMEKLIEEATPVTAPSNISSIPTSNSLSSSSIPTCIPLSKPVSPEKATVTKSSATAKKGVVKDVDYYRNLVKDHGNYKEGISGKSHGRGKFKSRKACIYFGTSRGCRNGSNCAFRHELSNKREADDTLMRQNAKRLKEG